MTRATSSTDNKWPTAVAQHRWRRVFESLAFSAVHVDNTCALAWYASHLSSAGGHTVAADWTSPGPTQTPTRGRGTPMRHTSPTEGESE